MLFFGIINIPLFKYFCDIPFNALSTDLVEVSFTKSYFVTGYEYNVIWECNFFLFTTSFFFFFYAFNSIFYSFYYFNFFFSDFALSFIYDYVEVLFQTSTSNYNFIEFCTLQKFIYVVPNETHLIFFRMYNSIAFNISGISIYLIYPSDYLIYFNKIQCFCFEELLLYPYESIDLPVVFFISNEILNFVDFFYSNKLYLSYLFLLR
jgi:hypothetical protein